MTKKNVWKDYRLIVVDKETKKVYGVTSSKVKINKDGTTEDIILEKEEIDLNKYTLEGVI